ncbi:MULTISPECIES: molybdopterin converting factor subunit 1 [unclassified Duganella]|uniref:molybdopterin converting factor subunit 1 n=1 Tax=unclassified Duganella TaxID=2636909 RepID=UPI0008756C4A|nr:MULTISPECIES: molybdopterin converting factor subunit 1 [unclassified Duganella]OEZ64069.1 molybdopterin synthase sulfur carrier subunit [Duganella sp. HH105]OFA06782.1 molybdopterin synthase sulfur carrier subunit [Duganella sp. HH101]
MAVTVKFFASVREALGASSETLELPAGVGTVGDLRAHLAARGDAWQQALGNPALRMACNQVMCGADAALADGAEVAFFPPVTGG